MIHNKEFVRDDGMNTNTVEGRNAHVKMPSRGSNLGGTTRPQLVPEYLDAAMYESNFALRKLDAGVIWSAEKKLRPLFMCILMDVGFSFNPSDEIDTYVLVKCQKPFSSSKYGGPWAKPAFKRLCEEKRPGDINRGDGYDAEDSEFSACEQFYDSTSVSTSENDDSLESTDFIPSDLEAENEEYSFEEDGSSIEGNYF